MDLQRDVVDPAPELQAADGSRLRRTVWDSLRWSLLATVLGRAAGVGSGLVMARVLTPDDFGIYAAGAVALTLMSFVNDVGIEALVVRWPGPLREVAPTAMTLVGLMSAALFGVMFATGDWFAAELGSPDGGGVVRLMAVALLVSGVFTINSAQVDRAFRQRARTKAEAVGLVATIGIGLGLALTGHGAYSLAWGQIVGNLLVSIGLYRASPDRFRPGLDLRVARQLMRMGVPLATSGLFAAATLNVDYLIVGHELGAVSLGTYVLAFNIASWPVVTFTAAVGKVSLPGFATLQHDPARLRAAFTSSLRMALLVAAPLAALLAGLALPVVDVLYGARWDRAAAPLAYLALLGVIRVAVALTTDLMIAAGWTAATFVLRAVWLVALCVALPIGVSAGGLAGVGIAQIIVGAAVVVPVVTVVLGRHRLQSSVLLVAVRLPMLAAALAFVTAYASSFAPVADIVRLAVGGTLGLAVYLVAVRTVWQEPLRRRLDRRSAVLA